jgi:hypothetical protein
MAQGERRQADLRNIALANLKQVVLYWVAESFV